MTDQELAREAKIAFLDWDSSGDHEPNGFAECPYTDGYKTGFKAARSTKPRPELDYAMSAVAPFPTDTCCACGGSGEKNGARRLNRVAGKLYCDDCRPRPELDPSNAELLTVAREAFRAFRAALSSGQRWNATDQALRDGDAAGERTDDDELELLLQHTAVVADHATLQMVVATIERYSSSAFIRKQDGLAQALRALLEEFDGLRDAASIKLQKHINRSLAKGRKS